MSGASARRIVQTVSAIVFVLCVMFPGFIQSRLFQLDALAMLGAAVTARTLLVGLIIALAPLVLTAFRGRMFCGWFCPLGTCIDMLDAIFASKARFLRFSWVKQHLALFLAGLAATGLSVLWIGDPLQWAARLAGLAPLARFEVISGFAAAGLFAGACLLLGRRGFCRVLCPMGALLGAAARFSSFGRTTQGCTQCGQCREICRMAALSEHLECNFSECIQCRECQSHCPENAIRFTFHGPGAPKGMNPGRRKLLFSLAAGVAAGAAAKAVHGQGSIPPAIRPPGAVGMPLFNQLCIRCGACVQACPTGGLSLALSVAGFQAPVLSGRDGGCAYDCNQCGRACPTGAIQALDLETRQWQVMAKAVLDEKQCIPHARKQPCLACYAACPTPAVRLRNSGVMLPWGDVLAYPMIDLKHCIGCGRCQAVCPVPGQGAVRVLPL